MKVLELLELLDEDKTCPAGYKQGQPCPDYCFACYEITITANE